MSATPAWDNYDALTRVATWNLGDLYQTNGMITIDATIKEGASDMFTNTAVI